MANTATDDFPTRVLGYLVAVVVVGTPVVKWWNRLLRESRISELKQWLETSDGKAYMAQHFQTMLQADKAFMYEFLREWKERNCGYDDFH